MQIKYGWKRTYPPFDLKCPDYWIQDLSSDTTICENTKDLGVQSDACPPVVNMDTFVYDSKLLAEDDCAKAQWARSCNLTWDGITNKDNIC